MRGLTRAALLALIVGAASAGKASAQTAAPKIGFINSAAILAQAPGRAEAETKFQNEVKAYQAQLQRMSDSLQAMAATFDKESATLDSTTRVNRAKLIQAREASYQDRARMLDSTMQTRQAELIRPIMENVQKVIEQVRSDEGYAMIFDVASQASVIVAADKNLDLTQKVIAKVKAAPAPKPASGPVTPQPAGVTSPKR